MAPCLSRLERLPCEIRVMIITEICTSWFGSIDLIVAGKKKPKQVEMPIDVLHLVRSSPIIATDASSLVLCKFRHIETQYMHDLDKYGDLYDPFGEVFKIARELYEEKGPVEEIYDMLCKLQRRDYDRLNSENLRYHAVYKMLIHLARMHIPIQEAKEEFARGGPFWDDAWYRIGLLICEASDKAEWTNHDPPPDLLPQALHTWFRLRAQLEGE